MLAEGQEQKCHKYTQWNTQRDKECIAHSHKEHEYQQHEDKSDHDGIDQIIKRGSCLNALVTLIVTSRSFGSSVLFISCHDVVDLVRSIDQVLTRSFHNLKSHHILAD